jgi:hypothetical protein
MIPGLIGQETLKYNRLRGMGHLETRERHLNLNLPGHLSFGACPLKRLYLLIRCDPTTPEEAVGVRKVDEVSLGSYSGKMVEVRTDIPTRFLDSACDYP